MHSVKPQTINRNTYFSSLLSLNAFLIKNCRCFQNISVALNFCSFSSRFSDCSNCLSSNGFLFVMTCPMIIINNKTTTY